MYENNFHLEVDVHGVRELEGLEVGVRDHGGRGAEVLDLLEAGHDLGPSYAADLVDELSMDVSFMLWIALISGFLTPYNVSHPLVQLGFVIFFFMSSEDQLGQSEATVPANQRMEYLKNYMMKPSCTSGCDTL